MLLVYDWPGNVRELKNAIERAMLLEDGGVLTPAYLPFSVAQQQNPEPMPVQSSSPGNGFHGIPLRNGRMLPKIAIPEGGTSLEEVERALVEMAMRAANSNQTHAARLLDISRDALRYKLKKFGLLSNEGDQAEASA